MWPVQESNGDGGIGRGGHLEGSICTKIIFPEQDAYLASVLHKCSVFRGERNLESPEEPVLH